MTFLSIKQRPNVIMFSCKTHKILFLEDNVWHIRLSCLSAIVAILVILFDFLRQPPSLKFKLTLTIFKKNILISEKGRDADYISHKNKCYIKKLVRAV